MEKGGWKRNKQGKRIEFIYVYKKKLEDRTSQTFSFTIDNCDFKHKKHFSGHSNSINIVPHNTAYKSLNSKEKSSLTLSRYHGEC